MIFSFHFTIDDGSLSIVFISLSERANHCLFLLKDQLLLLRQQKISQGTADDVVVDFVFE